MKKVLILSYFAPPCNLTAAQRIAGWARNLPKSSYYPIVVTRSWTGIEKNEKERLVNTDTKLEIEKGTESEIHRLPYHPNWRDKAFLQSENSVFYKYLSKILTIGLSIFSKIVPSLSNFYFLYVYLKQFLSENRNVRLLIISCNPFEQFFFGYLLKKEFSDLKWLADYRDDWSTNQLYDTGGLFYGIMNKFNAVFEKKWISNAEKVISVSDVYAKRLGEFHNREVDVVMNGYRDEVRSIKNSFNDKRKSSEFVLTYSGTIYHNQDFDVMFEAIEQFAKRFPNIKTIVQFMGAKGFNQNNNLLKKYVAKTNFEVRFTERIPWEEAYETLLNSNILFLTCYKNLKGIPTSKLFEYISTNVPIVLSPSDENIMESILKETRSGVTCNSSSEVLDYLIDVYEKKKKIEVDWAAAEKFSLEYQTKTLANLLDKI